MQMCGSQTLLDVVRAAIAPLVDPQVGDNPFGTFVDWNPRVSCVEHSPGD
jgi:hypothetical protein